MISNPTPDSFDLHQTQTLGTNSSYHPWIYSFNSTVSLAGASAPFAFIPVPKVKSKNGAEIVIDDRVQLANISAFSDFCKATMLNEEVSLNVYGKPELKEGGLPKTKVTYNKTVTMKGKLMSTLSKSPLFPIDTNPDISHSSPQQTQGIQHH